MINSMEEQIEKDFNEGIEVYLYIVTVEGKKIIGGFKYK